MVVNNIKKRGSDGSGSRFFMGDVSYFFFGGFSFFAWERSLAAMLFWAGVDLGFCSCLPALLASLLLVVMYAS
jgi:hypothetical protein